MSAEIDHVEDVEASEPKTAAGDCCQDDDESFDGDSA